jgi:hypothetical protein
MEISFLHSEYLAQPEILPGFNSYSRLSALVFVAVLIGALTHFWFTMTLWNWGACQKVACIALPVVLDMTAIGIILQAEKKTKKLKEEILLRYRELEESG